MAAKGFIELLRLAQRGQSSSQRQAGEDVWSGVTFQIEQQFFIAPLGQVSEVLPLPRFSPVPQTKPWVKGLANVRGGLMSVIDLSGFFSQDKKALNDYRVMCIRDPHVLCGVLVDHIHGVQHFDQRSYFSNNDQLEPHVAPFCQGFFRTSQHDWHVLMLNRLLKDPQFMNALM